MRKLLERWMLFCCLVAITTVALAAVHNSTFFPNQSTVTAMGCFNGTQTIKTNGLGAVSCSATGNIFGTGQQSILLENAQMADLGVAVTVKQAIISVAGAGNNTILNAVASKRICVLAYDIVVAGAVTVQWQSGAGGTNLSGIMSFPANGGHVKGFNPTCWMKTATNTLLNLSLGGAVQTSGQMSYIEVN